LNLPSFGAFPHRPLRFRTPSFSDFKIFVHSMSSHERQPPDKPGPRGGSHVSLFLA
jgi:hypothetical protein